jgi:hypothetical protein
VSKLSSAALAGFLLLGPACGDGSELSGGAAEEGGTSSSSSSTNTAASCVEVYSPETLANRSFAFDGSVLSIETRTDPKLPAGQRETPWVSFEVHRWYLGGSGGEVGIWMDALNVETSAGSIEAETGTRLLVAGEPRWGGDPLEDPVAWTCGFTQPWTEEAAAEWGAATV